MMEIESDEKGILRAVVAFTRRRKVFERKQRGIHRQNASWLSISVCHRSRQFDSKQSYDGIINSRSPIERKFRTAHAQRVGPTGLDNARKSSPIQTPKPLSLIV